MSEENPTINGKPATKDQFQRVLFLQERKRRIEAEVKLLSYEGQVTDAELDDIISAVTTASEDKPVAEDIKDIKEGAA